MEPHAGNTGTENPGAETVALRAYHLFYIVIKDIL